MTNNFSDDDPDTRKIRPLARSEGLIIEELDGELLVYDRERDKAHCLNGISADVWRRCDGAHSVTDLAALVTDTDDSESRFDVILLALRQLSDRHLIIEPVPREETTSRRDLMRKVAIAGAVGLAIPVIKSIVAPTAAQAATCLPPEAPCVSSATCCSGVCAGGFCL